MENKIFFILILLLASISHKNCTRNKQCDWQSL